MPKKPSPIPHFKRPVASTDFDEKNQHDNSILNILESSGMLIFFNWTRTGITAAKSGAGWR